MVYLCGVLLVEIGELIWLGFCELRGFGLVFVFICFLILGEVLFRWELDNVILCFGFFLIFFNRFCEILVFKVGEFMWVWGL